MICYSFSNAAVEYDGDNLLSVLGQNSTAPTFKEFKDFWLLDKNHENYAHGIKVYFNPISDKVESIIIAGDNLDEGGVKFKKCTAKLPFGINLDDDTTQLTAKLGQGEKLPGRSTMRYYTGKLAIEASYTNLKNGKISFLKFITNAMHPTVMIASVPASAPAPKQNIADRHRQVEQAIFLSGGTSEKTKEKSAAPGSPFKKAMLDVFKASRESSFDIIKDGDRKDGNFWNYKYTYNTKLKIPGEKYNMLYSFPFVTSQLDFVVVLKESDSFEKSLESMYHTFEKQLTESFPASEGWVATCLPGKDKSHLPDLEFRNDKYGAIILDHTQNPRGRHVLYLRFLLFSD